MDTATDFSWTGGGVLSSVSITLAALSVFPLLKSSHGFKINLSVWAVGTVNAWLAGIGNLFAHQKGPSAVYMILYAAIFTPVLLLNLRKGVWGRLPVWHKCAAPLLPVGTLLGILLGGEIATWSAFGVSLLLTIQLAESTWSKVARENLATWSLVLLSNSTVLLADWRGANFPLRCLLGLWILQNLMVIAIEIRNRRDDTLPARRGMPGTSEPPLAADAN